MKCAATGWGVTDKFGTQIPDALNEVAVRIIEKDQCENIHSDYQGQLSDEMICAGYKEGGRDACLGDSGGPLACQIEENGPYVLYGITSWGIGCGDPLHPGVYTRVTALMDWVKGTRDKILTSERGSWNGLWTPDRARGPVIGKKWGQMVLDRKSQWIWYWDWGRFSRGFSHGIEK